MGTTRQSVFNAILKDSSDYYSKRVSVANGFNIDDVASSILQDKALRNEFIDAIVNKVGRTIVNNKMIEDKLSVLDGESLPMGSAIEELFVNPAIAEKYDMNSEAFLKQKRPDVKALYYGTNRENKYAVTITIAMLKRGFKSDGGMNTLISQIVASLYSGDKLDNMIMKKNLVAHAVVNKNVIIRPHEYDISAMTVEQSNALAKEIVIDSLNMVYPSKDFNSYGKVASEQEKTDGKDFVVTFTNTSDQYILMRNDIYTNINFDVLAMAYNMEKKELMGKIIPIDNFGDAKIMALLCDKAWWVISDTIYETDEFRNGENLSRTTWLHHHQIMRYSMFANAVAYTYGDTSVGV